MAVISSNLRSSRFTRDLKSKRQTDVYIVVLDAKDGPEAAMLATGIPVVGQVIGAIPPFVIVTGKEAVMIGDPPTGLAYEVCVTGSTITVDPATLQEQDPVDVPAVISYATEYNYEDAWVDFDDKLVANSLGDPFDPPLRAPIGTRVITVRKCVTSYVDNDWRVYINAVNLAAFMGEAAETVLLADIAPSSRWVGGSQYIDLTATFRYRDAGWLTNVPDRGYRKLAYSGNPVTIVGADGVPANTVLFLDGHGGLLPAGLLPAMLPFRFVGKMSFTPLATLLGVAG